MTKRMDHLLSVVGETRRLVLQDRKTVTAARIEATRIRARERALEEGTGTVHDSYAPRRNAGRGPADLDQAIEQWMHGDEKAIREFLLSGDKSNADIQSIDLFLNSFSDSKSNLIRQFVKVDAQGLVIDASTRKLIEGRAMTLAEEYYLKGFDNVEDTSATQPFDLRCTKGNEEVRVEVKGSTGKASNVLVTAGEVENAQGAGWRTDLFIVSDIRIVETINGPAAEAGTERVIQSWRPKPDELRPSVYYYTVPD